MYRPFAFADGLFLYKRQEKLPGSKGRSALIVIAADRAVIKSGINRIKVFTIQIILHDAERFTEPLEVYNFSFTQEADRVRNIGIFYDTKNIIVSGACLLLCCDCV